jgi:hypothetical protein
MGTNRIIRLYIEKNKHYYIQLTARPVDFLLSTDVCYMQSVLPSGNAVMHHDDVQ